MTNYAHSPKDDVAAQTYSEHVCGVRLLSDKYARAAGLYSSRDGKVLRQLTEKVAAYHDLGKLDERNQQVLSGVCKSKTLPINHVDAGAAYWLENSHLSLLSASVIQAHHLGFPDYPAEFNKGEHIFRDVSIAMDVDRELPTLAAIHETEIEQPCFGAAEETVAGDQSVFLRMLLSCIADADHTDTAIHYGKYPKDEKIVPLNAEERLGQLDRYEACLQQDSESSERNLLRSEMYRTCRDIDIANNICSCDSPVGSGKTTAVMAHILRQSSKRQLRRIFVVLPFTNIIKQSVNTYREALTLPGENPEDVVAELHHLADFENEDARHLTPLWRAPVIVTTAVAFFETLASDSTATLRRLHELPGSAVFVDESHASLPVNLLPIAWRWIRILAEEWGCYWVLASGSLNRFWEIDDIADDNKILGMPDIVNEDIRNKLSEYEYNRINYHYMPDSKNTEELADWVTTFPGPRLVIMNTVQSAAVLADYLFEKCGCETVEHLSTALTPSDREKTLEHVKARLSNKADTDWTLVATSCVEAGINLSFAIGFHELCSLSSLLQAAGRVNREGDNTDAEMWVFRIVEDGMLKLNPRLKQAGEVLRGYFEEGISITPELTTRSISDEIALYGMNGKHKEILSDEKAQCFKKVEHDFRVIDSDTRLAVVDENVAHQVLNGQTDWRQLQKSSVQIAKYKLNEMRMLPILDEIYYWNLGYDGFLGYMAGMIKLMKLQAQSFAI